LLELVSRCSIDGTWLGQGQSKPRRVTARDMDRAQEKATSRTKAIVPGEFSIALDGRTLDWSVAENKNSVEKAYEHPVTQALFAALSKVTWKRGTGSTIWGSDEYAEDSARENPGVNPVSIQKAYGPLGLEREAAEMGMTVKRLKEIRAAAAKSGPMTSFGYSRRW
jgi:hypothetical protein